MKLPYERSKATRSAFTLIELLTVIAVVGILAGILLPIMSKVQTKAAEAKKMATYRQYFVANGLYSNDNLGNTCPAKDSRGEDMLWQELLAPYLLDAKKYSNKSAIYIDPFFTEYDPQRSFLTGAGINVKVKLPEQSVDNVFWNDDKIDEGRDFKLNQITEQSKRIFLGDSSNWFINQDQIDTTRHDNGNTGMFVRFDGSIAMLTQSEAVLAVTDPAKL